MKALYLAFFLLFYQFAFSQDNDVNCFPNPVSTELTLDFLGEEHRFKSIQVFNSIGQKQMESFPQKEEHIWTFDVSDLPEGHYFIRIIKEDGTTITKRFYVEK